MEQQCIFLFLNTESFSLQFCDEIKSGTSNWKGACVILLKFFKSIINPHPNYILTLRHWLRYTIYYSLHLQIQNTELQYTNHHLEKRKRNSFFKCNRSSICKTIIHNNFQKQRDSYSESGIQSANCFLSFILENIMSENQDINTSCWFFLMYMKYLINIIQKQSPPFQSYMLLT